MKNLHFEHFCTSIWDFPASEKQPKRLIDPTRLVFVNKLMCFSGWKVNHFKNLWNATSQISVYDQHTDLCW